MKVTVLFSSFRQDQLNADQLKKVYDTVEKCFVLTYGTALNLNIELSEINWPKFDVVLSLDEYPNFGPNPIQKRNDFRDLVAKHFQEVLPLKICYGGKVAICLEEEVKKAVTTPKAASQPKIENGEMGIQAEYRRMAQEFTAAEPRFTFDQLVLAEDVRKRILEQICILENRDKLFNQWGLAAIASPSVLLNLYGDSGTGKSMAAEAISSRLGKKILRVSYADIESKYHGEGPKRLKGIFLAAAEQDAVLFIDEADSLLSARLSNVTQGSEQAINSMRSQLLISLENYDGIVIFATNLIENYDKAFKTRLLSVEMKRPTAQLRRQIWHNHLYPTGGGGVQLNIPLTEDIDLDALAEYDFCGRDIRNAVKQACVAVVVRGGDVVSQSDLLQACSSIREELDALARASSRDTKKLTQEQEEKLKQRLRETKLDTP